MSGVGAEEDESVTGLMRLYWSSRSPFVRKVMVAAHELGLANQIVLERVVVGIVRLNEAVMVDNPLNKIPTLATQDNGVLFDSPVICEYLDTLADPPRLFPSGPNRLLALRMQALADGMMDLLTLRLFENGRPKSFQWNKVHEVARTKLAAACDFAEAQIAAEASAGEGRAIHIGHIALACALGHQDFRFAADGWRTGRPALTTWYQGMSERPSMVATEYENVY